MSTPARCRWERISAALHSLYVTPLLVVAAGLLWLEPFLFPVSALALYMHG